MWKSVNVLLADSASHTTGCIMYNSLIADITSKNRKTKNITCLGSGSLTNLIQFINTCIVKRLQSVISSSYKKNVLKLHITSYNTFVITIITKNKKKIPVIE